MKNCMGKEVNQYEEVGVYLFWILNSRTYEDLVRRAQNY